jgi:hypothetical protein
MRFVLALLFALASASAAAQFSPATPKAGTGLSRSGATFNLDVNGLTGATVAAADTLAGYDASAAAVRKFTVSDFAAALAGKGLAASSGLIVLQPDHCLFTLSANQTGLTGANKITLNTAAINQGTICDTANTRVKPSAARTLMISATVQLFASASFLNGGYVGLALYKNGVNVAEKYVTIAGAGIVILDIVLPAFPIAFDGSSDYVELYVSRADLTSGTYSVYTLNAGSGAGRATYLSAWQQ